MWNFLTEIIKGAVKALTFKQRLENKIDSLSSALEDTQRRLVRLEIISAIQRKDTATVYMLYDVYKEKFHGNSYIQEMVDAYKKNHKVIECE